jgi:hypothetical protein
LFTAGLAKVLNIQLTARFRDSNRICRTKIVRRTKPTRWGCENQKRGGDNGRSLFVDVLTICRLKRRYGATLGKSIFDFESD